MVSLYNHSAVLVAGCALTYLILSALVLYYAIRATKIDPSDPIIYQQRLIEAQGGSFDGKDYEFECEICETHVSSTAKHCGACNRCVDDFDHHCRWLNNCVGRANY